MHTETPLQQPPPLAGSSAAHDSPLPSAQTSCPLSADAMLVQPVHLALRVAFDDILTSRTLLIRIAGATGPDSGAISGCYGCIADEAAVAQSEALSKQQTELESALVKRFCSLLLPLPLPKPNPQNQRRINRLPHTCHPTKWFSRRFTTRPATQF
jgi:hypothetical protein